MLLYFTLAVGVALVAAQPKVTTDQGRIRGIVKRTESGEISEFLGIPYAQPPVGERRFKYPEHHSGWGESEYEATRYKSACMQNKDMLKSFVNSEKIQTMKMSEDCLYLNVFVPGTVDEKAMLPVVVWIHGGRLDYGSAEILGSTTVNNVEAMVKSGKVIVVTFNYRLNVFGFLTTMGMAMKSWKMGLMMDNDDDDNNHKWDMMKMMKAKKYTASGNMGLLDQQMVLKWVHKNIRAFGGDPMKVTLVGDEKGGASVSLHVLSPGSGGLFQRASSSSCVYANKQAPCTFDIDLAKQWKIFGYKVGCKSMNATELFTCLQNVEAEILIDNLPKMIPKVVIDRRFLPEQPDDMWKSGKFNAVDYILGINSGDGDFMLTQCPDREQKLREGIDDSAVDKAICMLSHLGYPESNTECARKIQYMTKALYYKKNQNNLCNLESTLEFARDAFILAPILKVAYVMSNAGADVYLYQFCHDSPTNKKRNQGAAIPMNAGLGTQVEYILGQESAGYHNEDKDMSRSMSNAWTTFAKNARPQFLSTNSESIDWPKYNKFDQSYVDFDYPMSKESIKEGLRCNASIIWNKLMPSTRDMLEIKRNKGEDRDPHHKFEWGDKGHDLGKWGDDKKSWMDKHREFWAKKDDDTDGSWMDKRREMYSWKMKKEHWDRDDKDDSFWKRKYGHGDRDDEDDSWGKDKHGHGDRDDDDDSWGKDKHWGRKDDWHRGDKDDKRIGASHDEHAGHAEPEPKDHNTMAITFYVMVALICLVVLMMLAVFGMMCRLQNAAKRESLERHNLYSIPEKRPDTNGFHT